MKKKKISNVSTLSLYCLRISSNENILLIRLSFAYLFRHCSLITHTHIYYL